MKLQTVRAENWRVLAMCTERGDCPLLDFLTSLEGQLAKDGRRMLRLLARVASLGPPKNTEISHQLDPGVWEFIQGRLRVLWFYDEGKLVLCSHGFVKKQQKTPRAELERAKTMRRRYLEAKRRGNLRVEGAAP
ncbi:MAG: type II toxin-antitoxin system RelE/ParE family toxin [Acidobacteriota bacterium]|nr:type II toxin-antitoxin system RelE/ParE family toxin [Acidobacteriota bacterium]